MTRLDASDNGALYDTFAPREGPKQEQITSIINLYNLENKELKKIELKGFNVWEVVFNNENNGLYFINSANNEVFGAKAFRRPEQFEIYELALNDAKPVKIISFDKKKIGSLTNLEISDNEHFKYVTGCCSYLAQYLYEYGFDGTDRLILDIKYLNGVSTTKDNKLVAFVDRPESKNGNELFITKYGKEEPKKLTEFDQNIKSPKFVSNEKIIFLLQKNWQEIKGVSTPRNFAPDYQLMTIDLNSGETKDIKISI